MSTNHGISIATMREEVLESLRSSKTEILRESIVSEHIGMMQPNIVYYDDSSPELLNAIESEFSENFVDTFLRENEEDVDYKLFNRLLSLSEMYGAVLEGELIEEKAIGKMARNVARKGENLSRKAVHGIRKGGHETKRVAVIAKKIPGYFTSLVNSTLDKVGKMDSDERKKRILEGSFRFKLFKILRTAATTGLVWAVNPALAVITLIVSVVRNSSLDADARRALVQELQTELKVVEEKIKDADQKGETQKKYQLMRIRDKLSHDLARIRFFLKGNKTSSKNV